MSAPLQELDAYPEPYLPPTSRPDATILDFRQPDTADQAVFIPEASAPVVTEEIEAATHRVKAAEHIAWVARNAVSAKIEKEPIAPWSHPLKTWRYERQLAQLQARRDDVATHLQQMQLALATLEYGNEYAPDGWLTEKPTQHPGTGLLRQAAMDYLKTLVKAKLA